MKEKFSNENDVRKIILISFTIAFICLLFISGVRLGQKITEVKESARI